MSEAPSNVIERQLKALQTQFQAKLLDQITHIQRYAMRPASEPFDLGAIQDLSLLTRDMEAAAKTFARADIGDIIHDISSLLAEASSKKVPLDDDARENLQKLSQRLFEKASEDSSQELNLPATATPLASSKPVYIVSDDQTETQQLKCLLQEIGFETCVHSSSDENQTKGDCESPALLVVDIDSDSNSDARLNSAQSLREKLGKSIPMILISSHVDFQFRLKAHRANVTRFLAKPIKKHQLHSIIKGLNRGHTQRYRILLIDDDEVLLGYHKLVLEKAGMKVLATNNAEHAWQSAIDFSPDVIVSDIYMPDCTGPELVSILRETDKFAHTPILFLSSDKDANKQTSSLSQGSEELLTKPIDPNHFTSVVSKRAQRSRHMRRINTELKQALRERDFQQNALNQHAIVSIADALGDISYVNSKFCEISGYTPNELLGHNHRLLKSGQHPDDYYQDIWNTITQGNTWSGTICNRKKDGSYYWVESTIVPFLDENKIPVQYISIRTEITPLMESEDRLRRSQAFANIGTWDWDIQTGQLHWSERIASLFGYHEEIPETTYENFLAAIHPEDKQPVIDAIAACVENGEDYDIEHRVVWSDGSIHWLHEKGDVTFDANGRPLHMLGAVQDITARHDYQEQLERAQTEAEQANRAKSEFLSSMSHELRTPLNAVLGFSQLLKVDPDHPMNEEQTESLDEIIKAGNHLLELINEVLDLSKIEAGHINLSLETVQLLEVIQDCENLVRPITDRYQVNLEINHSDMEGINLLADRTRLKQVLINFVSNAIKYNKPNGKVEITADKSSDCIKICVTDNGIGIDPEIQDQLFQPFNRLGAEETNIEGTGIGLVITKRLVESMGGEVGVESQINEGSTFWCRLPVATDIPNGKTETNEDELASHTKTSDTTQQTILYIEDNPANLRLVEQLVRRRKDLNLLSAPSAGLGIEMAMTYRPKVILLDINLPGMSGLDVITQLRKNMRLKSTSIIAVSANATQKDIEKAMEKGFDEYLTKPLDIKAFYSALDKYIAK
jgi:PAS domain S-box-containing protein